MPFITATGNLGLDGGAAAGLGGLERRQVGRAQQQENVGRVDRRGLDANDDFVRAGFRRRNGDQREFEFAVAFDKGAKLQPAHTALESHLRLLGRIRRRGGRPRATLSGSDARTKRSRVRTVARAKLPRAPSRLVDKTIRLVPERNDRNTRVSEVGQRACDC